MANNGAGNQTITITPDQLNNLAYLLFRRGYNFGSFYGKSGESELKAWNLMLADVEVNLLRSDIRPLFQALITNK